MPSCLTIISLILSSFNQQELFLQADVMGVLTHHNVPSRVSCRVTLRLCSSFKINKIREAEFTEHIESSVLNPQY